MGMPPVERVRITGARSWSASVDLVPVSEVSRDLLYDRIATEAAYGRTVAYLATQERQSIRAYVIERPDGTAAVVFDTGFLSLYEAPDPGTALAGIREVLASGTAYNW